MTTATGRPFNEDELINQIGHMNIFAISGGRVGDTENNQNETVEIELPVSNGYRVSIKLGWDDTWTVSSPVCPQGRCNRQGHNRGRVLQTR
jgi:hypothetical protein